MPYRRLPNTDQARLRALKSALDMGQAKSVNELAFSQASLVRTRSFFQGFENAIIQHKHSKKQQGQNSKSYQDIVKKARLYVSHFIQVLNFCILRGELKTEVREYYGIEKDAKKLPSFVLESDLLEWGKKIIEGEHQRVLHGGNSIYNPSIAIVKVKYDQFADAYHFQKTLQKNTARWAEKVGEMRNEADDIIVNIWNEVEEAYSEFPDMMRRQKAQEYGIVYFFRPLEQKKIDADKLQTNLQF
jgi:hypothetical protein